MNAKLTMLAAVAFLVSAGAELPIDLEEYPLYCETHGIQEYCSDAGYEYLLANPQSVDVFENELAYYDELVYTGPLRITGVNVSIDVEMPFASVEALYTIRNTAPGEEPAVFMARRVSSNLEVRVDGEKKPLSSLYEFQEVFGPGEEKRIKLVFTEGVAERIYSYNTNLMIDGLIPAGRTTPEGGFAITLPEGALPGTCSPPESRTEVAEGRVRVVWSKSDFLPWTNPFDDLICNWLEKPEGMDLEAEAAEEPVATAAEAPTDYTLPMVVLIIVAALVVAWARRRR